MVLWVGAHPSAGQSWREPHHTRLKAGRACGLALHPGAGERTASQGGITADGLNLVTRETSSGAGASLPL